MDKCETRALLESLWDRIEKDAATDKWRLVGTVSSNEREALRDAIAFLKGESPADGAKAAAVPRPVKPVLPKVSLDLSSAKLTDSEDRDVMLCLDFGTAMSKAFAVDSLDGTPYGLALGTRSGAESPVYAVPSSLYISANGKVHFGRNAIDHSRRDDAPGRRRFDSPKQELSQGTISDLGQSVVTREINPTDIPLTKKELITLYLAFLTDLASTELEEKHGISRYVARRFALPCWDEKRKGWAEQGLREMLAAAQVLADTFHDRWGEGLSVAEVKAALELLAGQKKLPTVLIDQGVAEPIAAAASRVFRGEPQRRPYLVVDVGAGTTDFGLFIFSENPAKGWARAFPVARGLEGLRQAGDTVDSILRAEILRRHGFAALAEDPIQKRVAADLDLNVRELKERLFGNGNVEYRLTDDSRGTIALDEFLGLEQIQRFGATLERTLSEMLNRIDRSWLTHLLGPQDLTVVLTGGGAGLPMVRALAEGVFTAQGIGIQRQRASALPPWIEDENDEFADEYPQLAVAMGGATPQLPEMMTPVERFGGQPNPTMVPGKLQISGS